MVIALIQTVDGASTGGVIYAAVLGFVTVLMMLACVHVCVNTYVMISSTEEVGTRITPSTGLSLTLIRPIGESHPLAA